MPFVPLPTTLPELGDTLTNPREPCPKCQTTATGMRVVSSVSGNGSLPPPAPYQFGCDKCGHQWEGELRRP